MSTPNAKYWHALNLMVPGKLWKLHKNKDFSHNPQAFFRLSESQLNTAGVDPSLSALIIAGRKQVRPDREWENLANLGIQAVPWGSAGYPKALAEIPSPPALIYIRGKAECLDWPALAVVGTRKITAYGRQAVDGLVPDLVGVGLTIVSGLAMGVDAVALESCLESGGTGVAVLAGGLDNQGIIPRSNLSLARRIAERGCLVSEVPPGSAVHKGSFPQRNRIISGLALGTLVIEAARGSGSLITANLALEQNRGVFAVPGSIFSPGSAGTNSLIARGARSVVRAQDIMEELGWDIPAAPIQAQLSDPLHGMIASALVRLGPSEAAAVVRETGRAPAEILAALTEMEMAGTVRQFTPGIYAKIK